MDNEKRNLVKSIRFPEDVVIKIEKSAEKETRTFSAQVIHIIKKYYELQENEKWESVNVKAVIWPIKD